MHQHYEKEKKKDTPSKGPHLLPTTLRNAPFTQATLLFDDSFFFLLVQFIFSNQKISQLALY